MTTHKSYWTVPEIALALNVPLITIDRRIAAGHIRAELQRGKVMVPASEVQRLIGDLKASARVDDFPKP